MENIYIIGDQLLGVVILAYILSVLVRFNNLEIVQKKCIILKILDIT